MRNELAIPAFLVFLVSGLALTEIDSVWLRVVVVGVGLAVPLWLVTRASESRPRESAHDH